MQTAATRIDSPRIGLACVCLFVAFTCVYLLSARGRITSIDEWHVYGTTESLVERGSWQLRLPGDTTDPPTRHYSRYSVVPSILGVPFYKLGQAAAAALGAQAESVELPGELTHRPMSRRDVLQAAVTLQTALVTAATATLLFHALVRLAIPIGAALATAWVYALGTLALPYSSSLYAQPLAALGVVWLIAATAVESTAWLFLAFTFVLTIRIEFLVLAPALAIGAWRSTRPTATLVGVAAGSVAGVVLNVLVNHGRGDPLFMGDYGAEGFTTPLWIGLHGLLFSSGKGLIHFAPLAVLGMILLPRLMSESPRVGHVAAGIVVTMLVMVSCWWTWHGGWSWGPRLLVPVMPVMALPLAWFFSSWLARSAGVRLGVVAIILLSIAVQARGVLTDPVGDRASLGPLVMNENESIYIPQTGPWGVRTTGGPDLLLARLWNTRPDLRAVLAAVVGLAALVAVGSSWWAMRLLRVDVRQCRTLFAGVGGFDLFALAFAMFACVAPAILQSALLAGQARLSDKSITSMVPGQFGRLTGTPSDVVTGRLYAPLQGDYVFYRQGVAHFFLDGRPVFVGDSMAALIPLQAGFHRLEIDGKQQTLAALYWTTPGNAHYKQPVPRLYLAGPTVSFRDRAAIAVARWKWLWWVVSGTALIGLLQARRGATQANANVQAHTP